MEIKENHHDTLGIFAKHTQKAEEWLNQIKERAGSSDSKKSLAALRATLHRLRDNLTPETVLHLSSQLPLIIKGILVENWHLSDWPTKDKKVDVFLDGIEEGFHNIDVDVEIWIYYVLQVLSLHISPGEVEKIRKVLPRELRELWEVTLSFENKYSSPISEGEYDD